jgi:all-trans-retinol 13,14-reductase
MAMGGTASTGSFDVNVIGSGRVGMTTATALSKVGHKVLLLEQAATIGGMTHTFSRDGFSWDIGLHSCGTFGYDQPAGRIRDGLSGCTIEFAFVGPVYDTIHFPEGFEITVSRPEAADKVGFKDWYVV